MTSERPREVTKVHARLLKCALEVEDARAYWAHAAPTANRRPANGAGALPERAPAATSERAFEEYWFGARSMPRIEVLLSNMRARFDAYPPALAVLGRWPDMPPDTRALICHWHLQLTDPLYRAFTGDYLVARRAGPRDHITRDLVVAWVSENAPDRWTMATRIQFASKLLSSALSAGLLAGRRDPRPLALPRVRDHALEYLLYLLREIDFDGTLLENPYLASVGLTGPGGKEILEDRLRQLPSIDFGRQGDLIDITWRYPDLRAWADHTLARPGPESAGAAQ